MIKIKETLKNKTLMRYSIFIVFTATLLVVSYVVISNFIPIVEWLGVHVGKFISTLSSLFVGIILAYLINPVATFLNDKVVIRLFPRKDDEAKELKRIKRTRLLSTLFSYVVIIAIVFAIIYFFTSLIIGQFIVSGISNLYDAILNYIETHQANLTKFLDELQINLSGTSLNDLIPAVLEWWQNSFSITGVLNVVTSLGGSIFNFIIGIIISIYLVYDKELFLGMIRNFVSLITTERTSERIQSTCGEINGVISSFIKGVCIDTVIVAILSSVALTILGVDFAVFIGIFAGICNVIPYFGPIIGMVPAFIIATFTDSLLQGVIAVVLLIIVQQIDCNIIYPRVVGSSTGLHPLFVLLAVSIIGSYGGLVGMIIAVPIAGIISIFVKKWAVWAEERKKQKNLEESTFENENKNENENENDES